MSFSQDTRTNEVSLNEETFSAAPINGTAPVMVPLAPPRPPAPQFNFGPAPSSSQDFVAPETALGRPSEFTRDFARMESAMQSSTTEQEVESPLDKVAPDNELNVLKQLQQATGINPDDCVPALSKDELAKILEGFAKVLRGDATTISPINMENVAQLEQMKELLLDAQGTIIGLLNDRVFDRAKISRLEAEVRLMPDLQAQATRAMGLAMRSEDVQKELSHVKAEVERLRTSYVRSDKGSSWVERIFGR